MVHYSGTTKKLGIVRYTELDSKGLCRVCRVVPATPISFCCSDCLEIKSIKQTIRKGGRVKVPYAPRNRVRVESEMLYSDLNHISQASLRQRVLAALGGKCCKCGFCDPRALQVDHIMGGGSQHIAKVSWSKRYLDILENPYNYQLLCANCNWIKRHENKEFGRRFKKPAA